MSEALFDPGKMPQKDEDGMLWHPDLDQFMRAPDGGPATGDECDSLCAAAVEATGWEIDASCHWDAEDDAADYWPEGDGWRLVARVQNDDGDWWTAHVRPGGRALTP